MKQETLARLRCPNGCNGELSLCIKSEKHNRVETGHLGCEGCGTTFTIESGIARMLPKHLHEEVISTEREGEIRLKRSEMSARDSQVDEYDKMKNLALFGKVEIPYILRQMNLRPSDVLLEAGCGTGRMTQIFAKLCQQQIGVDFSFESLLVCREKLDRQGLHNVDLIQADICALPLRDEQFHQVVSCGVLEHIPTEESRAQMIAEMTRATRPKGRLVISAYKHSLYTRLFDKKEGEHSGGIYYFRFDRDEYHSLLSQKLQVEHLTGLLMYYYTARCMKPAS
jgi:ubiquinone/menaquinone biosynthesis C-methylase UbiE/uncharacterized protein YbaR (Trm112 family)